MKSITSFLFILITLQLFGQKGQVAMAVNLNSSKSNFTRLIYPAQMITAENAQLLLTEFDQVSSDAERQKQWLASNFKRFGVDSHAVKQITIYAGRQYADCTSCKKNCKGRCVQDPGADCVCFYKSEPNLRLMAVEKPMNIILLSSSAIDEANMMDVMEDALKRATTVKSSKSNSSE